LFSERRLRVGGLRTGKAISRLDVTVPPMVATLNFQTRRPPSVPRPAAKPGRTPRRSATARALSLPSRPSRLRGDSLAPILTATTYDLAARPTAISDSTGQTLTYGFDSARRVISVAQTAPGVSGTRTVSYQLDAAGNKTRAIWADGYYVTYAFDALNRLPSPWLRRTGEPDTRNILPNWN
jgi:YD repeat-containing protein